MRWRTKISCLSALPSLNLKLRPAQAEIWLPVHNTKEDILWPYTVHFAEWQDRKYSYHEPKDILPSKWVLHNLSANQPGKQLQSGRNIESTAPQSVPQAMPAKFFWECLSSNKFKRAKASLKTTNKGGKWQFKKINGSRGGIRTYDQVINSFNIAVLDGFCGCLKLSVDAYATGR